MNGTTVTTQSSVPTTQPTQPYSSLGIDNSADATSCILGLSDYEDLRKQNLDTINTYYTDMLTKFTGSYTDYAKNSAGNVNDRAYAETQVKPQTAGLNNQMLALNKKMLDGINRKQLFVFVLQADRQ